MKSFTSWTKFHLAGWFGDRLGFKPLDKRNKAGSSLKPELLCLEERVTPATYTVTSGFDFNRPGDLRHAITQANASREDDSIIFSNVAGIQLLSQLPAIRDSRVAGTLTITGIDPRDRRQDVPLTSLVTREMPTAIFAPSAWKPWATSPFPASESPDFVGLITAAPFLMTAL